MIKIICFNCGKSLEAPDEAAGKKGRCPGCGEVFEVRGAADERIIDLDEGRQYLDENTRYPVLKSISIFFKIFAWINFVASVILFFFVLVNTPAEIEAAGLMSAFTIPRALLAIPVLVYGAVFFVIYYALAEIIMVFLDIELNTRMAAGASGETLETLEDINLRVNETEGGEEDG